MENLVKNIIKAVVTADSIRSGCGDNEDEFIEKLNKLVNGGKEDHDRLVMILGELACYGFNLSEI